MKHLTVVFFFLSFWSCISESKKNAPTATMPIADTVAIATSTLQQPRQPIATPFPPIDYDTSLWTEVIRLDTHFILNLKYATKDNFVQQQLYDCPRCFLRPDAAQALLEVQEELTTKNYRLMLFDCFRPRAVQQRLWDIMPNASYVTPPQKGSMHNRGLAVDLTLATLSGDTLEMGTPFDFFGPRAHHTYTKHSPTVLANRKLLKSVMEKHGFRGIRTEWWHYSFLGKGALAEQPWHCGTMETE